MPFCRCPQRDADKRFLQVFWGPRAVLSGSSSCAHMASFGSCSPPFQFGLVGSGLHGNDGLYTEASVVNKAVKAAGYGPGKVIFPLKLETKTINISVDYPLPMF